MKAPPPDAEERIMAILKKRPFFFLEELFPSDMPRSEGRAILKVFKKLGGKVECESQTRNGKTMILSPEYEPTEADWVSQPPATPSWDWDSWSWKP